jgi:hypothetical protein
VKDWFKLIDIVSQDKIRPLTQEDQLLVKQLTLTGYASQIMEG